MPIISPQSSSERPPSRSTPRRQVLIVCLLGAVVTFWGWTRSVEQHERDDRGRFMLESERAVTAMKECLEDIDLLVRSNTGLLRASKMVTDEEWRTFESGLFPNVVSSGVVRVALLEGGHDAPLRVVHVYPAASSDILQCSNEMDRRLLLNAIASCHENDTTMCALILDPMLGEMTEVLVAPVARRDPAVPLAAQQVAVWIDPQRIVSVISAELDPALNVCIHRDSRFSTCSHVSDEPTDEAKSGEVFPLRRESHVPVGDEYWTLELAALPAFREVDLTSAFILATGLLLTVLLASVVGSLHVLRASAVRLAEAMTAELRASQDRLRHDSLHDALTGLPNRMLFRTRLADRLAAASLRGDFAFAVLFLDLDRFKVINDSLGHAAGDELLIAVARRLERGLRSCGRTVDDLNGDTIARMGGDEFTVLLERLVSPEDADAVADRLQRELSAPYCLLGQEVFTSASVGIRLGDASSTNPEDILRDADTAMYQAKAGGKARHEMFDSRMQQAAGRRLAVERDLRRALERRELYVEYQPIIRLDAQELAGFESLVRWRAADGRLIAPAEFIPVAEDLGLIGEIGRFVLDQSCAALATWHAAMPEQRFFVSVNLSRRQLAERSLVDEVRATLQAHAIPPDRLILEITESVVMDNPAAAADTIQQLRNLGVQLWMDDFGTGYSSLSCLHRLPIDGLKIDRSFVMCMESKREDASVVGAIVALAHSLGIKVTAEGVETSLQLARLQSLRCDQAQGYYFARPLSLERAGDYVLRGRSAAAAG
jgi:diguanylate cyclase (GGDEF)-like protein